MKKEINIQNFLRCFFCSCLVLFATACKPPAYLLTMDVLPIGSGTVDLLPSGGTYLEGTEVTLSPKPVTGYEFTRWSGTDSSSVRGNKTIMIKDVDIIAMFTLRNC